MKSIFTLLFFIFLNYLNAQILFYDIGAAIGIGEDGANYGSSVGDFNNDGFDDIYVTRRPGANRLFKNNGDGTFTDVAETAGVDFEDKTRIALWGDFDNDGCLDLFLANDDGVKDKLYLNNCDGTFTDISEFAGIEDTHKPEGAVLGDVDNDGLIDIYLAHINGPNILWKNNGVQTLNGQEGITFTDVTVEAGVTDDLVAMGAVFFDYDNDRDLDLYLVHDNYGANILFQNDGTGNFVDVAVDAKVDIEAFGMGADVGDVNNDGWLDIYVTNLYPNNLLLNNGDGTFTDITDITDMAGDGVGDGGMGWGTAFLDIDNDTHQDILFVNTAGTANGLLRNLGDNTFENVATNTPLAILSTTYGAATLDYNNDGKIDFFVPASNTTSGNHFFVNSTNTSNHWIKIITLGTTSNHSSIGTRVDVFSGGNQYVDLVCGGSGWASQNSMTLHFGLGDSEMVDSVKVLWANGETEVYYDLMVDDIYTIEEGEGIVIEMPTGTENIHDKNISMKILPNPANENVFIEMKIMDSEDYKISIYDLNGQLVKPLLNGKLDSGTHKLNWNIKELNSGIYFTKIENAKNSILEKLIIIK